MEQVSTNNFKKLLLASWNATRGERIRFFVFVALFTIAYTIDLFVPWAMGYTLGVLVAEGFTDVAYRKALLGLTIYIGLRFINAICHHLARYLQNTVTYQARMNALNQIFGELLKFPLHWHIQQHSGDNLSKLHRAVGAVENFIGLYLWQIIDGVVKVVFAAIAIFTLDFWVALNVILLFMLTIGTMIFFNSKLRERYRRNNAFANKLSRICVDYLFNIVTVKTLHLENEASKYLNSTRYEGLEFSQKISQYNELKWGIITLGYGAVIGTSLWIYFAGQKEVSAAFDIAKVYVLLNYLDRIFQAVGAFTGYYSGLLEAATAFEDGAQIIHQAEQIPSIKIGPIPSENNWQEISIQDISFSYPNGDRLQLQNASFSFKNTEKIALVGPSGGGKSTLLKILSGALKPLSGSVLIDDQKPIDFEQLARLTLLVPQEPEIFSETLIYNLTMGETYSRNEINQIVNLCGLEPILAKLPASEETNLAEKGLNVSVGEKQRIALARGLLRAKGREIILLDEPTSSLDPKIEKEIFLGLLKEFSKRVIISAIHRLHLVPLFDSIIFVRNGSIVEKGSFAELLNKRGEFAAIWEDFEKRDSSQTQIQLSEN
ncbi:MAG TPA: ABC transporter ATP-binding protein [Oligoflexia bacterium]|nr:ABC transporter ATP-binding protein [Oligoflexia bacterium]HMP26697.1 ABC transporter ATP-binding protein [Oligoflexia bacterium]